MSDLLDDGENVTPEIREFVDKHFDDLLWKDSPATPPDDGLREALRDILFRAAGGIKDMADEEIDEILALFHAAQLSLLERVGAEVIGKNETVKPWLGDAGGIRNIFRAEQRAALDRLKTELTKGD